MYVRTHIQSFCARLQVVPKTLREEKSRLSSKIEPTVVWICKNHFVGEHKNFMLLESSIYFSTK